MYPNSPHVDEPTMTDLRGILPGQRPPVDAPVLDEPTSEVPIIKPASVMDAEPEPEAAVAEPAVDPEPAAEIETDTEPELTAETETAVEAELDTDTETAAPEVEVVADAEPEVTEPVAEVVEAEAAVSPEPLVTPPVVPGFDAEAPPAEPTSSNSEMAKMAWSPMPPPGLVPSSSARLFEPAPWVTEPEPVEVEPVTEVTEVTEPEPAEAEVSVPAEPEPEPEAVAVAEPAAVVEPAPPAPGEVAETSIALWSDEATAELRDQWRELQVDFIDDPNGAVTGAKSLVTEAVRQLADTLLAAQDELDPFRGTDGVDTEAMRVAMRRYREFLDRVLAL